jgi:outer membrane murein-binding lipoprotein Lpp
MKNLLLVIAVLGSCVLAGCGRNAAPEPLPPDRAVIELNKSFANSKPEAKALAEQAATTLQAGRYPEASTLLMKLSSTPGLGAKEREVVTSAMLGVNRLILEAQARGDAQSAEHLRRLQESK